MDQGMVVAELHSLRRARLLHAAPIDPSDIPGLWTLLHLDQIEPADRRTHLFEELALEAERLPGELSTIFLVSYGITYPAPFLNDRLTHAGKLIDRDPRTVRRRLAQAEQLLVRGLVESYEGHASPPGAPRGWFYTEFDTRVELRADPVFTTHRTLRATAPRLRTVTETVSFPGADGVPSFTGLQGARLVNVQRTTSSVYHLTFDLEAELVAGQEHEMVTRMHAPSVSAIRPMSVMMPVRPCRRYSTEVSFGDPPMGARVWALRGLPPTALEDPAPEGAAEVAPGMVVREEFEYLVPGLAYGLRWSWADGIADSRSAG